MSSRDPHLALSFGASVDDYERGRPGYPDDAVDWLLAHAPDRAGAARVPARARAAGVPAAGRIRAVDVGAGTGKFTRSLLARELEVTAVEPDDQMRGRLATELPPVTALAGSAESMPLPTASAELVTFAQAWHWVDPPVATAEIARVLVPDGVLGLVWNIRDESVEWVARLGAIMGASEAERYDTVHPALGAELQRHAHAEFCWSNPLSREQLHAMVASRSYMIVKPEAERAAVLAEIDELLDAHPDLAGREVYDVPYLTRVTIATRVR
ncbi:class I SAM-dependent methyltransferase [Microbacteriaceae bacterium VKM Ac-2855]|nr:class I SAM-dependent methyltransferase [Microbacteriaceae bacterium VKM Ac-2855]